MRTFKHGERGAFLYVLSLCSNQTRHNSKVMSDPYRAAYSWHLRFSVACITQVELYMPHEEILVEGDFVNGATPRVVFSGALRPFEPRITERPARKVAADQGVDPGLDASRCAFVIDVPAITPSNQDLTPKTINPRQESPAELTPPGSALLQG